MDRDVIIVGAGAAGLAAACRLAERSVRAIVPEGRDDAGNSSNRRLRAASEVAHILGIAAASRSEV